MKFKKNSPFLDEVTAHGALFKGPKEVFVCPECGSEHVTIGENLDFGLPIDGIFKVMETRRECVCKDCGCEFKRIYGRKRTLSDTSKGIFLVIMGVILSMFAIIFIVYWAHWLDKTENYNMWATIIIALVWALVDIAVGVFGILLIEAGAEELR